MQGIFINLQYYQYKNLFKEIKNMKDFLLVKLKLMEYLFSFWNGNRPIVKPYVYIDLNELHRAFLVDQHGNKVISFGFEFNIITNNINYSYDGNNIVSLHLFGQDCCIKEKEISEVQTIIQSNERVNTICLTNDFDDSIGESSRCLLEYLLLSEPGYFRCDYDTQIHNSQTHPINHIDVNFSKSISYKLGLKSKISKENILQLLRSNSSCVGLDFNMDFTQKDSTMVKSTRKIK